jgi:hypothetical protein
VAPSLGVLAFPQELKRCGDLSMKEDLLNNKPIESLNFTGATEKLAARYVDAPKLLEILFDEASRPSLRWVREQQRNRTLPFCQIGRLVFFDPQLVKARWDANATGRKGKS